MKQDKRFIKTEKLIHDAFFEVLKNENYNSVTVDKICKKALIGKNTFYSHYKNKDAFLFSVIDGFTRDFALFSRIIRLFRILTIIIPSKCSSNLFSMR